MLVQHRKPVLKGQVRHQVATRKHRDPCHIDLVASCENDLVDGKCRRVEGDDNFAGWQFKARLEP
jgi:hypothetical protein